MSDTNPNILYLRAVRDHAYDADLRCAIRYALTRLEKAEAEVARLRADRRVGRQIDRREARLTAESFRRAYPKITETFANAPPGSECLPDEGSSADHFRRPPG